jgi:hypothetical protein
MLPRQVDHPHAATAHFTQDLVTRKDRPACLLPQRGIVGVIHREGGSRRRGAVQRGRPQRGGDRLNAILVGEEARQVVGQVRVAGQQPLPARRPARLDRLQVGGEHFVKLFFAFVDVACGHIPVPRLLAAQVLP